MKKNVFSFVFALCLIIPAISFFTGCSCDDKSTAVISFNTNSGESLIVENINNNSNSNTELLGVISAEIKLDLVVDANNKIISVTPQNSNADQVIANVDLIEKDIDTAVNLIMENLMLSGNIKVKGSTINVTINGDSKELLNNIENKVNASINNIQEKFGLTLSKVVTKLEARSKESKEALIKKLEYLAPELTNSEIDKLTVEQLMEQIKIKSIELKNVTYENFNDILANFEKLVGKIKEQLDALGDNVPAEVKNQLKEQFDQANENFKQFKESKLELMKSTYETLKTEMKTAYENAKNKIKAEINIQLQEMVDSNELSQEAMNEWLLLFEINVSTSVQ